jgi:ABC-type glycerol-3-phosphate transport system permease component
MTCLGGITMVNDFRSKGEDAVIVLGLLLLITVPLTIMAMDKIPDVIDKVAIIAGILLFNITLSIVIPSKLYIRYISVLDNGLIFNNHKVFELICERVKCTE